MNHHHTPNASIPGPDERATLNAALRAGIETGFWDEHGVPAPWPDDIDEWRPVTTPPNDHEPGRPAF
jgi:hypothetical protein